jgi:hypothetical protein
MKWGVLLLLCKYKWIRKKEGRPGYEAATRKGSPFFREPNEETKTPKLWVMKERDRK